MFSPSSSFENGRSTNAEIVAMRSHLANIEYGMKAIADACRRAGNKTISFRGAKAEFVIN
ncbi:hypothetical protein GCZ15_04270 [Escherichia coli]|nr:hypothetical protein [Salmonella enterica subsp. enterica serovar Ruiru]ECD5028376.1 hypothetical protein [Salmonella enterica subsp. enterica serovar Ruiru]EFH9306924.1 hypothetical protein [Escherichia coli]